MLTATQVAEIEKRMEDEHRKDREALSRLKRFLDTNSNGNGPTVTAVPDDDPSDSAQYPDTIIGKISAVMQADPTYRWTVPAMHNHLRSIKYPLLAQKPEATIGITIKKLQKRKKIMLVRQGAGRRPNVYRWRTDSKDVTQEGSESERATQGQPAHVH